MPRDANSARSIRARSTLSVLTAALVVLGTPLSATAANHLPGKAPDQVGIQIAAQQFKPQPRNPGPVRPTAPKRQMANPGAGSTNMGCHDHASQTSYEGPCDYYPEYEATGGCESSAEQASLPGNCPNSSEP